MADWNAELYSRFEKERTIPSYDLVRAVEGEPKTVLDIGCGIVALLPIEHISVSRISHPKERFRRG